MKGKENEKVSFCNSCNHNTGNSIVSCYHNIIYKSIFTDTSAQYRFILIWVASNCFIINNLIPVSIPSWVMYGCGLRFGEAVNLLWDDQNLDLEKEIVHIVNRAGSENMPIYNIKDYEARSIKMPKFAVTALAELKTAEGNSSPFVFLCKDQWARTLNRWHSFQEQGIVEQWDSKELMGSALRDFKLYCSKAGIKTHKKLNLHSLRKGYGSNMAQFCPPHTLKELMGHSSIVTTMDYYVQDVDENKKKAVEGLDRMMGE